MSEDTGDNTVHRSTDDRHQKLMKQLGETLAGARVAEAAQYRLETLGKLPVIVRGKSESQIIEQIIVAARPHNPKDAIEADLVTIKFALEQSAFDALARSQDSELPMEFRVTYSRAAEKLLSLTLRYLEALEKKKRGGEQRIVVEHRTEEPQETVSEQEPSLETTDDYQANNDDDEVSRVGRGSAA